MSGWVVWWLGELVGGWVGECMHVEGSVSQ